VTSGEWAAAEASGEYAGSALDARDGYMHLSPPGEVAGTAAKYYAGRDDVVVLEVDLGAVAAGGGGDGGGGGGGGRALTVRMDWVPARGAFFPHVYGGPLPVSTVVSAAPLVLGAGGEFVLPASVAAALGGGGGGGGGA
jgi:uncharacterized protein (DUF952 family)